MNDLAIEQEIQAKGLTAPRVTPADIEANIAGEYFFTAEQAVAGFNGAMVDRFLSWKLPKDFAPDGGISFEKSAWWPSGTNMLHAGQAKEMLQHVVGGAPVLPALGLLTFCVLVLKNGFTVTGESACASPENFDAELGRKIARQNAVQKIWPLMGYELRSQLAAEARGDVNHDIGWAVRQAKLGKKVARAGWNGRGLCVIFYVPSEENVIPHLRLRYPDGMYVSWAPSSTDSVMQDWEIVS